MIMNFNNINNKYKNIKNIRYAYKMICMNVLNINEVQFYKNEFNISLINLIKIKLKIKKFIRGIPLNYIIKEKIILGLKFYINKNVLIPRNETEELIYLSIREIKKYFKDDDKKIVFDVCTGSLVIATCVYNNIKNCIIYANDISKKAIKVARKNNKLLNNNNINLIKSNIIDYYIDKKIKCDILICNPPYINKNDLNFVHNKEPRIALIAKDKGLFFYEEIIKKINFITSNKAIIIFEIGYNQKFDIEILIKKYLKHTKYKFIKDINGQWRMIFIYLMKN